MTPEEKEALLSLQRIDCNCNDCGFMQRDGATYKSFDALYTENGRLSTPSHRPQYGNCAKFNKPVSFLTATCQLETQDCFIHRRDAA